MISPDLINGAFELFGGALNWLNVRQLQKDKQVRGVSLVPTVFFSAWGLWNLYYYPHLGQWWSFAGGCVIVGVNVWWCALALKYRTPREPTITDSNGVTFRGPYRYTDELSFHARDDIR